MMKQTANDRPTVTVHMMSSVDGRIMPKRWGPFERGNDYEEVHNRLAGQAWMCGRLTMRGYTRGQPEDDRDPTPVPRIDHIAKAEAKSLAVALDFHGRLHWGPRNDIEGDHVVVITSEAISHQHLNALRASGVSYLFAGRAELDLASALQKLKARFGIERLLVEGGGGINGTFLKAGLVDELSLLVAPAVDGGRGVQALFDYDVEGEAAFGKTMALTLTACEPQPNGVVWLRYDVGRADGSPAE